jgi:hypothetical protein
MMMIGDRELGYLLEHRLLVYSLQMDHEDSDGSISSFSWQGILTNLFVL